jgi:tetratricopeptide (TPR) repeat protein
MKTVLALPLLFVLAFPAPAQEDTAGGDPAIAERYVIWAEGELAAGRTAQALAGLERGADYASVSADLLYLLAKTRQTAGRPLRTALEAAAAALENGRWSRYTTAACLLLEAEIFVELRQYDEALFLLESGGTGRAPLAASSEPSGGRGAQEPAAHLADSAEALCLRLRCRAGLGHDREFILLMKEALDRYPRDPRFPRLLFAFCRNHPPDGAALTRELVNLSLKRLSFLVEDDPELAYLAAPYMADHREAARFVAAYRAQGSPHPASLPPALSLGLLDDAQAVTELFSYRAAPGAAVLDRALILDVWDQLRSGEGRDVFRRNLLGYSGVIKEDEDGDGIAEITVNYQNGLITRYTWDADQDRLPEWDIGFNAGVPVRAEVGAGGGKVILLWERYPAVLFADLNGVRYIPRPADFFFTPLRFAELVSGGSLYPERDTLDTVITERSLLSFAVMTERPSAEFSGGLERTEFQDAIPVLSKTWLRGKLVAETEFSGGRPSVQRADLDNDGRMETIRHFGRGEYGPAVSSESDWDGDGIYEYAEIRQNDGTVKKYWDLDKDGTRETER